MADELKAIEDYPDVSFIDGYTLDQLNEDMLSWYQEKMEDLTGSRVVLAKGDDRRLRLQTDAYYIFQAMMMTDDAGKMGLLKYARGDYLDNLGALKHVARHEPTGANTTIRFSLQEVRTSATPIPAGTRVTAGDNIYFATDGYAEIPAGSLYADVGATCMETGAEGNDYDIGDINKLVDPTAWIYTVSNITVPENGTDLEDDDTYRLRIYLSPSGYSTAGTEDSYKYYVLSFNPEIADVIVESPEPRIVDITFLLEGGVIPQSEAINGLKEYIEQKTIKPITDKVNIKAPQASTFNIALTYYINRSDSNTATKIQAAVSQAIEDYKVWQCQKIGRDINPDELIERIKAAGAKRVVITSPVYTPIGSGYVAQVGTQQVTYGGLEDD